MPQRRIQPPHGACIRRVRGTAHAPATLCAADVDVGPGRRRLERVVRGPEPSGHAPEVTRAAGPLRDDAAVGGTKVIAAAGGPHRALHPSVDRVDEVGHRLRAHRQIRLVVTSGVLQRPYHVVRLRLEHEDHAVGTHVGVGPVQHEQVREARHRHAQVGVCAVAPTLVQCGTVLSHHLDLAQIVRRGVSRCADDHVDVEFAAVLGDQRPGPQGSRRAGDHLDVGPGERGNEVRGEHQPLATQRSVGRQPAAQFGVGNGVLEHRRRHARGTPASCRCRARSPRCWTHCAATAGSGGTSWRTGRARRSTAPLRCRAGPASAGSRWANAGSSRPCLPPWPPPAAVARQSIRCRAPRRSCRSGRASGPSAPCA